MPIRIATLFLLVLLLMSSCRNKQKGTTETKPEAVSFQRNTVTIREVDTVAIGRYRLLFSPVDSAVVPDFNEQHGIKFSCGQTGYFTQYSNGIGLHLQSGDTLHMKHDSIRAEEYWFHSLLPAINHYLVKVQYPEGNSFLLVNRLNGQKVPLLGWPYLSPSRKYIAAVNEDQIAGHSPNALQLLQARGDSFQSLFILDIRGWGTEKVLWMTDTSFLVEKKHPLIDTAKGQIDFLISHSIVRLLSAQH